jgi:uncharacterized protein (DUF433 family)
MAATTSWITQRPHFHGVEGCIRDTNINVWMLVCRRRLGWSDEEVLQDVPGLRPEDLEAAWEYYRAHPEEIEGFIRRHEEA